jgi:2-alkyl-3-oxoalkanoate reductase
MPHKTPRLRLAADNPVMIIFVTGAAGLLGGALVAALLAQGHGVIGLVHRQAEICGNDGVAVAAPWFEGSAPQPGHAAAIRGDVRQPGLGLDAVTQAWLAQHVDVVVHCAALVQFEADMDDLAAVNVDGTRHVAALFATSQIVHVSTAYVCGLRDGLITETPCDPDGAFGNGYEASKARGEAVLHAIRPDAVIVRPSIIVGELESGRIRSFDTIYRAFKFIAEGRVPAIPVTSQATLDFVPIDHVVSGICDVVGRSDVQSSIVHLAAHQAVSAARFLSLIGSIPGLSRPDVAPITGIAARLGQPYWGYFKRHPEFETRNLARLTGRAGPMIDDAALIRQIEFCIDAGFIRPKMKAVMRELS